MVVEGMFKCTVGDVAAPNRNALVGGPFGSDLVSRDYVPTGVPVIRGANMGHGRWVDGDFVYVTSEKADSLASNCARPGDLVFTQRGTLGQVALVPKKGADRYLISQSQMKVTLDPAKADSLFLYYVFISAEQQAYIVRNAITTGVPHTNLGILRNTPLKLPPLADQKNIAAVLGALDDKIELNRRINATLEAMARALFQSWFVDFDPVRAKLDGRTPASLDASTAALFSDSFQESPIGHVPLGWRVVSLADLMDIQGGTQPPASEFLSSPSDGYVRLVQIRDYESESHLTFVRDTSKLRKCRRDDVMIARYGASVARICWGLEGAYNVALVKAAPLKPCYREFLRSYLQAHDFQARLIGMSNRSVQAGFNKGDIASFQIAIPPDELFEKYETAAWALRRRILHNKDESRTLATLRDTLLPRLLSGDIRLEISAEDL